jgi:hypothetical protein
MTSRRSSTPPRKARRASPQQMVLTVIGLLVILSFIFSMLR